MKRYAIDFAYEDFFKLVYTIKWIQATSEETAIAKLNKKYKPYGGIILQYIRVVSNG